jgi:alpha-glucosidase
MDAFNLITLTLPGVAVTYQGEELGMTNANISYEDTVDPSGCNCGPDRYDEIGCSRDPERTPFQWSGTDKNAGFSNGDPTWLPVNSNFVDVNVESERDNPDSHLNIYKTLIQARYVDPAFDIGDFFSATQNNVMAFSRTYNPDFYPTYVTVVNFNREETSVDFSGQLNTNINTGLVLLSTMGSNSAFAPGSIADLSSLILAPNEGILIYLN